MQVNQGVQRLSARQFTQAPFFSHRLCVRPRVGAGYL
jgi:hypothetical protein